MEDLEACLGRTWGGLWADELRRWASSRGEGREYDFCRAACDLWRMWAPLPWCQFNYFFSHEVQVGIKKVENGDAVTVLWNCRLVFVCADVYSRVAIDLSSLSPKKWHVFLLVLCCRTSCLLSRSPSLPVAQSLPICVVCLCLRSQSRIVMIEGSDGHDASGSLAVLTDTMEEDITMEVSLTCRTRDACGKGPRLDTLCGHVLVYASVGQQLVTACDVGFLPAEV